MAASASQSELRLVVLGPIGAENGGAACSILGLEDSQQGADAQGLQECTKHRGEVAGRKVVVVSTPAWYSSACSPEERRSHISCFVALSSPGPHAFLLCVPVNEPAHDKSKALDALEELFGPAAVAGNTVVLFTHTEELGEDETLEQYIVTWRKDLRELVGRCGDRYHALEKGAEEGRAVEELLEKVEQAVKESGTEHFSCPLYQEAEDRVRRRQIEIVRLRRSREEEEEPGDTSSSSNSQPEVTEEELGAVRGEAERSTGDLDLDLDGVFPPSATVSPPAAAPSLLWGLWEKLMGWIRWLPSIVRQEALLGSLVGLLLGGRVGGTVGATVGSVATEVSRRKTEKKNDR